MTGGQNLSKVFKGEFLVVDTRSKERPKINIYKNLDWIARSQKSAVGYKVPRGRCEEEETNTDCPFQPTEEGTTSMRT